MSLLAVITVVSCGSNDATTKETTDEQSEITAPTSGGDVQGSSGDAAVIEAYAKDKSSITTADIDPKDTSFTTRTKSLYISDDNGKKLAVVYGFKSTPKGVAIIEVEGEKPITLKQVETAPAAQYEFTNGIVTLKKIDKAVELNENGEVITYKEIF